MQQCPPDVLQLGYIERKSHLSAFIDSLVVWSGDRLGSVLESHAPGFRAGLMAMPWSFGERRLVSALGGW